LNAFKNINILQPNESSVDNSSSDISDQGSKYTTFCTTHTQHSSTNCDVQKIPTSIYLADVDSNLSNMPEIILNNNIQAATSDTDQYSQSIIDMEEVDGLFQCSEMSVDDLSNPCDDITIQSTSNSVDNWDVTGCSLIHSSEYQQHSFDQTTRDETASFQVMSLLDAAGAPRICYDRLVALLKKLTKKQGFDVQRALNRETLMRRLARKYTARPRIQRTIRYCHIAISGTTIQKKGRNMNYGILPG